MNDPIVCTPKTLPPDLWESAASNAREVNPDNQMPAERLAMTIPNFDPDPGLIAVLTTKYWRVGYVKLTVGFLDSPSTELKLRILSHMNAWNKTANVQFVESQIDPQVRIARTPHDGHWSYLGTDVLLIDPNLPTMNLESFTMETPESEFLRVVRHETGHTLGFPHEHLRREFVDKIDVKKAIAYYGATQGWDETEVRRQVLTPIEDNQLWISSARPDPFSIMCYQIPRTLAKDGKPILGGVDIDPEDYAFAARIYPKVNS